MTDEELVSLSLINNIYYDQLVERHYLPLFNFVFYKLLLNRERAEDIVQETFLKAYLKLNTFKVDRKFKTWLYRIAINTTNNYYRKGEYEPLDENNPSDTIDPVDAVEKVLSVGKLRSVMKNLPEDKFQILSLYYIQGKSVLEISREIKKPIFEVKNRLRRAESVLVKTYYIGS